jgi:hypothetical protein
MAAVESEVLTHFAGLTTSEEIKNRYRELATANHPQLVRAGGGSDADVEAAEATMRSLNAEFTAAMSTAIVTERPHLTTAEVESAENEAEGLREAVEAICHLPGIVIEVRGTWLWVYGDTKAVKDDLGKAGFHWSPAKDRQPWYWKPGKWRRRRGSGWSDAKIRAKYGSRFVRSGEEV